MTENSSLHFLQAGNVYDENLNFIDFNLLDHCIRDAILWAVTLKKLLILIGWDS